MHYTASAQSLLPRAFISLLAILAFSFPAYAWEEDVYDPFEGVNRGIFWFNDRVDRNLVEPVAREYEENLPVCFRKSVSNFFDNLKYPTHLVASLISRDFENAWNFTSRFLLNSTIGIAGLIDVAGSIGIDAPDTDIGAALGGCGVPAGPYLMLPILGPSNLRDGLSWGVESAIDPLSIASYNIDSSSTNLVLNGGAGATKGINTRARLLDAIEAGREASVDYYLFSQSAYYQYRHSMILRARGEEPEDFEMELEDEEWLSFDDDEELAN